MTTRKRALPPGWYPADEKSIGELIDEWKVDPPPAGALAAIAPHAGWAFSGKLAVRAAASLRNAETIVVFGGHLPGGYPVLAAPERFFETPLGAFEADFELKAALEAENTMEEDRSADNTVEIQLPILRRLFPAALLLWLRVPASHKAIVIGRSLANVAAGLGRQLACIGSTDLTHYGPDYGFLPAGRGPAAEAWVREKSDKGFIDALLGMDPAAAIARGEEGAACSSGAAAAALSFAMASGATKASLLGYATSLDIRKNDSFVGYCAVGFY